MIHHDIEQNTEAWETLRLGKATASNFACFMANDGKAFGDPAKRYALEIALEIATKRKSVNGYSNGHMERGHEQEPIARALYSAQTFTDILKGGFYDCGDYGASPDGLADEGLVEFKSVIAPVHFANITRGSFDPAYRWQLVGLLDCSERPWVDFCSYCADFPEGKQLFVSRLYRTECLEDLGRLRSRRGEFLNMVDKTLQSIMEIA